MGRSARGAKALRSSALKKSVLTLFSSFFILASLVLPPSALDGCQCRQTSSTYGNAMGKRDEREMAKHKRTSKYAVNAGKQEMPKMPTPPLKSDRQSNLQGTMAAIFRMLVSLKLSKGLNMSHTILLQLQIQKSALTSRIQQRSIVQCNGHSQEEGHDDVKANMTLSWDMSKVAPRWGPILH